MTNKEITEIQKNIATDSGLPVDMLFPKKTRGGAREGAGRKPRQKEAATTTMSIVCTASEKKMIKEFAKNSGLSISGFVLAAVYFFRKEVETNN